MNSEPSRANSAPAFRHRVAAWLSRTAFSAPDWRTAVMWRIISSTEGGGGLALRLHANLPRYG